VHLAVSFERYRMGSAFLHPAADAVQPDGRGG